jgi:hypothetical protein
MFESCRAHHKNLASSINFRHLYIGSIFDLLSGMPTACHLRTIHGGTDRLAASKGPSEVRGASGSGANRQEGQGQKRDAAPRKAVAKAKADRRNKKVAVIAAFGGRMLPGSRLPSREYRDRNRQGALPPASVDRDFGHSGGQTCPVNPFVVRFRQGERERFPKNSGVKLP